MVAPSASAQVFNFAANLPSPLSVPDNSAVGTSQALFVTGITDAIQSIQVQLALQSHSGDTMFNGDLYVTLVHNGTQVVLLNREGRRAGFSAGYGDAGFNITLSDTAAADLHSYRVTLTGSDLTPLAAGDTPGALTGTWQPDGRSADPATVLTTSPRTTSLSLFTSTTANGTWSLFLSDLSPGATADLVSWNLSIATVPESTHLALGVGLSLITWAASRRRPSG